jgi:hypothetical protein
MQLNKFLQDLLNVLLRITNKMELQDNSNTPNC